MVVVEVDLVVVVIGRVTLMPLDRTRSSTKAGGYGMV